MTQLSAATRRNYREGDDLMLPVKASAAIYEGSAVGLASGVARQLNAGDIFAGFALDSVDAPSADAGAYVRTRRRGRVEIAISAVALADVGKRVYASDGNTFTLTESTNTAVGVIVGIVATGTAIVAFNADAISLEQIALHVA